MGKRIIIIGGVAGGASAAARARRLSEEAEIILVERGEYVSFANCGLPYYIGGEIKDRAKLLLRTPEALRRQNNIDVRVKTEAVAIDTQLKTVLLRNLATGEEKTETYDALILSPGATPIRPAIPGADLPNVFVLRTIADMDAIVARANTSKSAIIVGAGLIGLEMAEELTHRGLKVILVERLNEVLAPLDPEMAGFVRKELISRGVELHLNEAATAIKQQKDSTELEVTLSTGARVRGEFVIISIGVKPDVSLAQGAGIALGERGGIRVDEFMRTSAPDVYAVGDAVELLDFVTGRRNPVALAGPANRQGRIAANVIFGREDSFTATQATWIVRVFSLVAAGTGANEKALALAGIPYEKIYVHPFSHATYYPGATQMALKLLFSTEDGKILGAQIVGGDGVDKRIDVLATALRAGLTVFDLQDLELSYAPPFGAAKDGINMAGLVSSNFMNDDIGLAHWSEVEGLDPEKQFLLDVRNPDEIAKGAFPNAVNIPLPELRDRLDEIPKDKEIITACAVGMRGYSAARILMQNGFKEVRNLSGGYRTWVASKK